MKTLRQTVLPLSAGVLFAVSVCGLVIFMLSSIVVSLFAIPCYICLIVALFRRRRNHLLTAGTVLMILFRLWLANYYCTAEFPESSQPFMPMYEGISLVYLVGTVLLFLMVLVNVAPKLKRYRPYVNPFWFLPGLVMLGGLVWYICAYLPRLADYQYPLFVAICAILLSLFYVVTPPLDVIGTLLIPLWLKLCAPDDLKPYEEMAGQMFTPEQLEEKRLELGLAKRKKSAV